MRVTCLFCDVENDALETGGFCDNCGTPLALSARARPAMNAALENSARKKSESQVSMRILREGCEAAARGDPNEWELNPEGALPVLPLLSHTAHFPIWFPCAGTKPGPLPNACSSPSARLLMPPI